MWSTSAFGYEIGPTTVWTAPGPWTDAWERRSSSGYRVGASYGPLTDLDRTDPADGDDWPDPAA